jgi:hypothetical protein
MHRIARLRRERGPHFAPALGWEIVSAAEYERKSEVDGLIGDAPRTQLRCGPSAGKPHGPARK